MSRRLGSTIIVLLLSIAPARAGVRSSGVEVKPENVQIGLFYSGQEIRVKATTPASRDVVLRVIGPEEPLVLKRKGKKYGFLWMNVDEIRYEAVPTLYILRSSRKLDEIAAPQTLDRLKLGFDALRDQVPAGSRDGARELFSELVKLKQKDHLFSCQASGVELHSVGAGRQEATGTLLLPAKTPVGDYTVEVFGFHDGEGTRIGAATVHLKRTPVVASITSLVAEHGLLYGCLAVVVAVAAGLFTGFIFGK
jgi:uncharacterized protein (TIGR02186 family)